MGCPYAYEDIFRVYGQKLRDILIGSNTIPSRIISSNRNIHFLTSGAIWPDSLSDYGVAAPPYFIYERKRDFDNDHWSGKFKGLVCWAAQPNNFFNEIDSTTFSEYKNDVGFYVVPNFGNVTIETNVEYRQVIAIAFDSNTSPDYDPYGTKIINEIDWFINKHRVLIEEMNSELSLGDGRMVWLMLNSISTPQPVSTSNSSFVRRTVTYTLRYKHCS